MPTRRASRRRMVLSVGLFAVLLIAGPDANACDTWVAMGDVTTCGYTILGKNSDRPRFGCQPLVMNRGRTWPAGATIDLVRVTIPQVKRTYTTLGSSPYWSWGYEEGINEHSVAIGNEAIWTKVLAEEIASHKAGKGPPLGPTGMDLVRLGLERGKTARGALDAIAAVVERHGQCGSASPTRGISGAYHNSFIIADPTEAWILETTGGHWVAKRLRKGSTSISNGVSLAADFDLTSANVVQHAIAKGWWPKEKANAKKFHFQHAYSPRTRADQPVVTRVHGRAKISRRVLLEKTPKIDVRWMMHVARSPGINIMTATASSSVAVLPGGKDQLPVYWWCAAVPSCSCYIPFFVHGSGPPKIVTTAGTYGNRVEQPSKAGRDTFSAESFWWLFRDLSDKVMANPKQRGPIVRTAFDALEKEFEAGVPDVMKRAVRAENTAAVLDEYTAKCLEKVLREVRALRARFSRTASPV